MGAATKVFVKVVKTYTEWVEVEAVTLSEAKEVAKDQEGVIEVLDATYMDVDDESLETFL